MNINNQLKKCKTLLQIVVLSCLTLVAHAETPATLPDGGRLAEVHVLSLQFQNNNQASLVARPCDKDVGCDNLLVRINNKTTLRDNGTIINFRQAKRLKWELAVVVVDKFNNALMLSRIPVSSYD